MRRLLCTKRLLAVVYCAAIGSVSPSVHAQWVKVPPPAIPRTAEGKPDMSAPATRSADGRPDLSGIWEPSTWLVANIAPKLKPDELPLQAWARELYNERLTGRHWREDPPAQCLPQSVPLIGAAPAPWKIIQTPGVVVILYEAFNLWRQIFLDGRELALGEDLTPTWMGYSTGKWDG